MRALKTFIVSVNIRWDKEEIKDVQRSPFCWILDKTGNKYQRQFLIHCRTNIELEKSVQCSKPQEFNIKGGHSWQNLSSKHDLNLWGPYTALSPFSISYLSQAGSTRGPHERFNSVLLTLAFVGYFYVILKFKTMATSSSKWVGHQAINAIVKIPLCHFGSHFTHLGWVIEVYRASATQYSAFGWICQQHPKCISQGNDNADNAGRIGFYLKIRQFGFSCKSYGVRFHWCILVFCIFVRAINVFMTSQLHSGSNLSFPPHLTLPLRISRLEI